MKKMIFIMGIVFGVSLTFLIGFITDLIFLVNFPNEGIVPNPWTLGVGIIGCMGSVMISILLPSDALVSEEVVGGEK